MHSEASLCQITPFQIGYKQPQNENKVYQLVSKTCYNAISHPRLHRYLNIIKVFGNCPWFVAKNIYVHEVLRYAFLVELSGTEVL